MDRDGALPYSYQHLHPSASGERRKWVLPKLLSISTVAALLLAVGVLTVRRGQNESSPPAPLVSRGVNRGVSEKSTAQLLGTAAPYPWNNAMLSWQRTAFHFQPPKNWMNDPNGPMHYKGWYHLFYQYNPDSAVWGNITWGHAVSRDLIHWFHLPLALVADAWYDAGGVWSGSATHLPPDGHPILLYTGSTSDAVQLQNVALPADPDDPLLLRWIKHPKNPVLTPPPGIRVKDFRDPTTAWKVTADAGELTWRVAIGSKDDMDHAGIVLVYATEDLARYELLPGFLHRVAGTGMWECIDFYPVATGEGAAGIDTSTAAGPGLKHVIKASLDDNKHDYYAIGSYDAVHSRWVPDDPEKDVGIGERYDWGKYYASKTFYDSVTQRRILWGWIGETDSERADILKGWSSVQAIPRTVHFDNATGSTLRFWPVEEVEGLRLGDVKEFAAIDLLAGSVVPIDLPSAATQIDIMAEFEIDATSLDVAVMADVVYNCSTSGGAAGRGALGPFGLLVLADDHLSEQLATYFYVARGSDGDFRTFFCQDELRSSKADDIVKRVYGSTVPVLQGELLSVRILVDHSIVESFSQGGRTCITSRVYPTSAIYEASRVFLFNNATTAAVKAVSIRVWEMDSAYIRALGS